MNRENLRDFAIQAQALIDEGAVEDRIRHYLSSRLLSIFPDYPWWLQAHMQGTKSMYISRRRVETETGLLMR